MKTRYFQYPLQKTLSYCSRKHFQTSLSKTMNGIGVALIAPTVTLVSFIALVARKSKAESWGIMSHSSAEFIGGNPNHADDDSNYSQLTLLEKRNRNIERNKNFFMTLFGSSDPGMSHSTEVDAELKIDSSLGKIDSIKLDELILCEEKKRDDIVASLSVYFPHREDVLKDLMGYMNPVRSYH